MDNPFEKLARGSYYLLLGNVTTSIIGALFWIILAKIVNAKYIGEAMVVISLMIVLITFASSGLQTALTKYIAELNTNKKYLASKRMIRFALMLAIAIGFGIGIILFSLSNHISMIYKSDNLASLIAFISIIYIPSQIVVECIKAIYTAYHRTEYVLLITIIFQASRLVIAILLALYDFNAFAIIAGFSIASLIQLAISYTMMQRLIPRVKEIEDDKGSIGIKDMLTFSGFNYIAMGMRTLRNQIGVLIIGFYNIESSAFYGVSSIIAASIGNVMVSFATALLPAATEEITKGNKDNVRHIFNLTIKLALILNGFLVLLLIVEPSYLLRLISDSYVEASEALRILVIAYLINSTSHIMGSLLNALNRAKDIAIRESIGSIIIIILSFILAPILSLEGLALAMLTGSLVNIILAYILINRQGFVISLDVYKVALSITIAFIISYIILTVYGSILAALVLALSIHATFSLGVKAITIREILAIIKIIKKG